MNTKRCTHCHKLQRADAQTCINCGQPFASRRSTREASLPSDPPASSHRAGHYSGLHPEDQPYHSRGKVSSHPTEKQARQQWWPQQDPKQIVLPVAPEIATRNVQRDQNAYSSLPTRHQASSLMAVSGHDKAFLSGRMVSILLTLSCIIWLLSASVIAFVLIRTHNSGATAVVQATPNILRVDDIFTLSGSGFSPHALMSATYDGQKALIGENGQPLAVHVDNRGSFSVSIQVTDDWTVGQHTINVQDEVQHISASTTVTILGGSSLPPSLALSQTHLDFPGAAPGVVSSQNIILHNTGGGQLSWQESSDQAWLMAAPNTGTFAGSQSVRVSVNRGGLSARRYIGNIKFTQRGKQETLILTVNMMVTTAKTALSISTTSLNFAVNAGHDPNTQTLTLRNDSTEKLSWNGNITTSEATPWLSITPAHGQLDAGASQVVSVSVQSNTLAVGTYQGTLQFSGDATAQVDVVLTVLTPGKLVISPPSLDFVTTAGQSPPAKTVSLTNTGGSMLTWSVSAVTNDQGNWLSAAISQGAMAPAEQDSLQIIIDGSHLQPGSYQGTLTFTSADQSYPVAISLTVAVPLTSGISAQPTSLNFTTNQTNTISTQQVSVTNKGNTALDWSASIDRNSSSFISVSPVQGHLEAGQSATLTVRADGSKVNSGTFAATLSITGNNFQPQKVAVQLTVYGGQNASLTTSLSSVNFTSGMVETQGSQSIILTNSGKSSLLWSIRQDQAAPSAWLDLGSTTNGQLASGAGATVVVSFDSSSLSAGTYHAQIQILDSSTGSVIKTIPVTLVVP